MRFICGLGKKVLLANAFAKVVDSVYSCSPTDVSRKALWLAAILYMLQIYYDFSGYSDMAIGLGKMFGFDFVKISVSLILQLLYRISGEDGISPCPPGFGIMCIFLWGETDVDKKGHTSI